jgi:hypothetical protein
MIDRPSASSARARALTSNALSVPIVCIRAATRSREAVAIIESPVAMEEEHHRWRSAPSSESSDQPSALLDRDEADRMA